MSRFFPSKSMGTGCVTHWPLIAASVAGLAAAVHRLRARGEELVLDDTVHLGQFPAINAGRPVWDLLLIPHWQEHPGDTLWRPLAKVLWSRVGAESILLPAVTVLAAAILAGLLAWFLISRCRLPPMSAVLCALIPVCHPLAADVLLPYVGQMDLLAAVGLLGTLVLMSHPRLGMAIAGGACFAMALLSKESVLPAVIALPVAVAALAPNRQQAIRRGGRTLILVGVVVGSWFVVRAGLFAGAEGALGSGGGWYREGERRLSQLELLGRYFAAFFDPRTPQTDYSFLKQPGTSARAFPVIGVVGLMAMIGIAGILLGRMEAWDAKDETDIKDEEEETRLRRPWRIAAAMVWVLVFLLPYLQFVPIGALWAGRFAFLSLIGLAWLVAEGIAALPARPRTMATGGLAVLLLVGTIQINRRAPDWSDAMTMWTSEVHRQPTHAFAWSNLAVTLQHAGDPTAGLEAARHATELFPTYGESWLTRGRLERAIGDHAAGRQSYYRAEELLGDHLDLQMEIARLDASEGQFEIALARLEAMAHKGSGNQEYEELIARIRNDLKERQALNQK